MSRKGNFESEAVSDQSLTKLSAPSHSTSRSNSVDRANTMSRSAFSEKSAERLYRHQNTRQTDLSSEEEEAMSHHPQKVRMIVKLRILQAIVSTNNI